MRCRVCAVFITPPSAVGAYLQNLAGEIAHVLAGGAGPADFYRELLRRTGGTLQDAGVTLAEQLCATCSAAQARAGRRLTRRDRAVHLQHLLNRQPESVEGCGFCLVAAARRMDGAAPRAAAGAP